MGHFIGGSAYMMARDVAEGYILLNDPMLRKFIRSEVQQVLFELDKLIREARGEAVDQEDVPAIQRKNRRVSRINAAVSILKSRLAKRF
ncbi:MAG: hypothetical protein V3U98_10935 [Acidobacteriota bacterium]